MIRRQFAERLPKTSPSGESHDQLLSVVIPTRNRRGLLARALEWWRAKFGVLEVIVVDDGRLMTRWFLATQADVRVARSRRRPGVARTPASCRRNNSPFDSDDLWFPGRWRRWPMRSMRTAGRAWPDPSSNAMKQSRRRDGRGTQTCGFENYFSTWLAQLVFAGMIAAWRRVSRMRGFSTQAINLEDTWREVD